MKLKEICNHLELIAPKYYSESYDNVGLICGNEDWEISAALITLDCIEAVLDEAIDKNCNLIIAHHPIVFSGLKNITGSNYIERTIIKAIKNDIAIYAIHTNLDNLINGVNGEIANRLGLENVKVLRPYHGSLRKLSVFVPNSHLEEVRNSLFEAGAGTIGNYDNCSFVGEGQGSFKAGENTDPFVGEKGKLHLENEVKLEMVFIAPILGKVIHALLQSHPYEEVAYDVYKLENTDETKGSGIIGDLQEEISFDEFFDTLKRQMKVSVVRHTKPHKDRVRKIAVCGGSGSFLLPDAIAKSADVFVSADFKYHQFFDADGKIIIADIGHFESEQFTPDLLQRFLQEKIPNFATYLSSTSTNPINYY